MNTYKVVNRDRNEVMRFNVNGSSIMVVHPILASADLDANHTKTPLDIASKLNELMGEVGGGACWTTEERIAVLEV